LSETIEHVKQCARCGEWKDIAVFSKHPKTKDRRHAYCKACQAKYRDEWNEKNPGRHNATTRAWQERNKEKVKANVSRWQRENKDKRAVIDRRCALKSAYGMTIEDYDEMLVKQGGVCLICSSEANGRGRLHVDHNHETDAIRGLLCSKCNTALGLFGDDAKLIRKAAKYLEENS
jgi:hypothetical protein